jgi:predicted MFS family arabinose efflux permease
MTADAAHASLSTHRWKIPALLVLFAMLFGGHGVLWVYQERIGHALGMSGPAIGIILGGGVLAGALGAALAGLINKRISHMSAQVIAFGGSIAASLVVVYGQTGVAFTAAALVLMGVWFFGLTYLLALTAELDRTGRLTGLANASVFVGQALGPVAAAAVVGDGNFRAVGWLSAGIYLICIVLAVSVTASAATGRRGISLAK